jgi:ABC-type sugar transport system substrate-binding protein
MRSSSIRPESALNPVLEEATKQGIVVVDFDHAVTAASVDKVGVDFVKFGGITGPMDGRHPQRQG